MLIIKASKTLKLMIVTHFQRFFRCPGVPKKDPLGQPNFICLLFFFVLGSSGVQGAPRRCPREPKRGPWGWEGGPKKDPGEAKGDPKGIQGNPKGVQGEPRKTQKGGQGEPWEGTVAGRPQASGIYIYIYIYLWVLICRMVKWGVI